VRTNGSATVVFFFAVGESVLDEPVLHHVAQRVDELAHGREVAWRRVVDREVLAHGRREGAAATARTGDAAGSGGGCGGLRRSLAVDGHAVALHCVFGLHRAREGCAEVVHVHAGDGGDVGHAGGRLEDVLAAVGADDAYDAHDACGGLSGGGVVSGVVGCVAV
jgi:hypothetical protein